MGRELAVLLCQRQSGSGREGRDGKALTVTTQESSVSEGHVGGPRQQGGPPGSVDPPTSWRGTDATFLSQKLWLQIPRW